MEPVKYEKCPNCGEQAQSDGVNNGVGYVYPPMHCDNCGWSEHCHLWNTEQCSRKCTEYEYCTSLNKYEEE